MHMKLQIVVSAMEEKTDATVQNQPSWETWDGTGKQEERTIAQRLQDTTECIQDTEIWQ